MMMNPAGWHLDLFASAGGKSMRSSLFLEMFFFVVPLENVFLVKSCFQS